MQEFSLDLKDKKILYQLDLNSRQPNSDIAKKVGLSKDVVNYRIKKLEKEGFIKSYYTILNLSKLGYFSIRVYAKFFDAAISKQKEIIDFLVNHNKSFSITEIEGPYDFGIMALVKNIYEFEEFYLEFKKKFKQYIQSDKTAIFTGVYHFHRAYLLDKKTDDYPPEYFGRSEIIKHDEIDIKILRLLAKNSRIPTIEISKKLNIPARTIAFRIKQLEKKKIIQGYRILFNFELYGYEYYKVDINLKDTTRLNELIAFAHSHPNIIYIDQTIGGSDFEFDVEVKNKQEFRKLMQTLKNKFPEIRTYTYFTAKKYNKLLYFPEN